MRYKEIISKKKKIKESQPSLVDNTATVIDNKITIIEYDDMTDYQKEIVDSGMSSDGVVPMGITLDNEKFNTWYREQVNKAKT
jgi:hypothetical protein